MRLCVAYVGYQEPLNGLRGDYEGTLRVSNLLQNMNMILALHIKWSSVHLLESISNTQPLIKSMRKGVTCLMHILYRVKQASKLGLFVKSWEGIYCCFSNKTALTLYKAKINPPKELL